MSNERDTKQVYKRIEERRKLRANRPIEGKLAIAEKLRDLQKALAPIREANKARVRGERRRNPT